MMFKGTIDQNGKINLVSRDVLHSWALKNAGKTVKLEIRVDRSKRTTPQNAYYWGVVIVIMTDWFREVAGYDYDNKDTHEALKAMFNKEVIVSDMTGEVVELPKSTTKNSTTEMMEYIDKIVRWASEFCGVVIPCPNEQLQAFEEA